MRQQLSNAITQAVAYLRLFGPHSEEYKQAYNSVQEARDKIKRARREGRWDYPEPHHQRIHHNQLTD